MTSLARTVSQKTLLAIGARRPFDHAAMARRAELTAELARLAGNTVLAGPFRGMALPDRHSWGDGDHAPKLLGTYEENLTPSLLRAASRAPTLVMNVGCAEGYFAVGLARLLPQAVVHAFDIDRRAGEICARAAGANGVADRVVVQGKCDTTTLRTLPAGHDRVLIFMDCEGGELELLQPAEVPELSRYDIIVETHGSGVPSTADILAEGLGATHVVERILQGGRDPNRFAELASWPELDRWLVINEMRPQGMTWLACWSRAA